MRECQGHLSDWQAGFRPERGCRDNILLLRVLYDQIIKDNSKLYVTYIDYYAAFDSVSHNAVSGQKSCADRRLPASRKTRTMFRAIYKVSEGMIRLKGLHNNKVYSHTFKMCRGMIQGDIITNFLYLNHGVNLRTIRSLSCRHNDWQPHPNRSPRIYRWRGAPILLARVIYVYFTCILRVFYVYLESECPIYGGINPQLWFFDP